MQFNKAKALENELKNKMEAEQRAKDELAAAKKREAELMAKIKAGE